MNSDVLSRLLEDAVPEPPRFLDSETVLVAARRRHRNRTSRLAVAALAFAIVAIAGTMTATHRAQRATAVRVDQVPLTISALDHQTKLSAEANKLLTGSGMAPVQLVHPGRGALVATHGTDTIYLTQATGDRLCVIDDDGHSAGWDFCEARSDLLTTGLIGTSVPDPSTPNFADSTVIAVVPDGYRTATIGTTTVRLTNNVAILEGPFTGKTLTIAGPKLPTATFNLTNYFLR